MNEFGLNPLPIARPKPTPTHPLVEAALPQIGAPLPYAPLPYSPTVQPALAQPGADDISFAAPAMPVQAQAPVMPMQMEMKAPQSQIQTEFRQMTPEDRKALQDANRKKQEAIQAETAILAKQEEENAKAIARVQGEYDASLERSQKLIAQKQNQYDTGVSEYKSAVQKYAAAKLVDPVAEKNIFSRIGAAIAVGLGAYASSITKTPNFALNIVNDSINRAIDKQRFEIEKLGVEAASKKNDLARLQGELANPDVAEKVLRASLLERAKMQVDVFTAASKSDLVKARGAQLIATIDQEQAKVNAEANMTIQRKVDTGAGLSYQTAAVNKMNPLQTPLGQAYSETAANKVRESYAGAMEARGSVDNFIKKLDALGYQRFEWGSNKGTMKAATDEMKNVIRLMNELGVLQPGEDKVLEEKLAGFKMTSELKSYAKEQYGRIERKLNSVQKAYIMPGTAKDDVVGSQKRQFGFER